MLIASDRKQIRTPTAIALGNFDGIHQGHCSVLRSLIDDAAHSLQPHVYPSVVSFTPHPREFFTGEKRQLLTPIPKKRVISRSGYRAINPATLQPRFVISYSPRVCN